MSQDLWPFKYAPKNFNELVLTADTKATLEKALTEFPNLMLYGPPGVGKDSFRKVFFRTTGLDHLVINASDENNVDTVRSKIRDFSLALGISDVKYVYLGEVDYFTPNAFGILRSLIEEVHKITRFMFTCNDITKIPDPILSRCQVLKLDSPPADQMFNRCLHILKSEGVTEINKKELLQLIKNLYPDFRRVVNALQGSVVNGKFISATYETQSLALEEIWKLAKNGFNLDSIRKTLRSSPINYNSLYQYFFDHVGELENPAEAILTIGEYLYRDSIIAIKEINFLTCLVELKKKGCV